MAAKPVNGRLLPVFVVAPASTWRLGWVALPLLVLGLTPPPAPVVPWGAEFSAGPVSCSPSTPPPLGVELPVTVLVGVVEGYAALLALLLPDRPVTARPAPAVLSSMPNTSMVRM